MKDRRNNQYVCIKYLLLSISWFFFTLLVKLSESHQNVITFTFDSRISNNNSRWLSQNWKWHFRMASKRWQNRHFFFFFGDQSTIVSAWHDGLHISYNVQHRKWSYPVKVLTHSSPSITVLLSYSSALILELRIWIFIAMHITKAKVQPKFILTSRISYSYICWLIWFLITNFSWIDFLKIYIYKYIIIVCSNENECEKMFHLKRSSPIIYCWKLFCVRFMIHSKLKMEKCFVRRPLGRDLFNLAIISIESQIANSLMISLILELPAEKFKHHSKNTSFQNIRFFLHFFDINEEDGFRIVHGSRHLGIHGRVMTYSGMIRVMYRLER